MRRLEEVCKRTRQLSCLHRPQKGNYDLPLLLKSLLVELLFRRWWMFSGVTDWWRGRQEGPFKPQAPQSSRHYPTPPPPGFQCSFIANLSAPQKKSATFRHKCTEAFIYQNGRLRQQSTGGFTLRLGWLQWGFFSLFTHSHSLLLGHFSCLSN